MNTKYIPIEIIAIIKSFIDSSEFIINNFRLVSTDFNYVCEVYPSIKLDLRGKNVNLSKMCHSNIMKGLKELKLVNLSSVDVNTIMCCEHLTNLEVLHLENCTLDLNNISMIEHSMFVRTLREFEFPILEDCETLIPVLERTATISNNPLFIHKIGLIYHYTGKIELRDVNFDKCLKLNFLPTILFKANESGTEPESSFQLYSTAATMGCSTAQRELANMYMEGRGVETNYSKAFDWFHKSAKNGNVESYFDLAVCFDKGIGTKQNSSLALQWFEKSFKHSEFEPDFESKFLIQ